MVRDYDMTSLDPIALDSPEDGMSRSFSISIEDYVCCICSKKVKGSKGKKNGGQFHYHPSIRKYWPRKIKKCDVLNNCYCLGCGFNYNQQCDRGSDYPKPPLYDLTPRSVAKSVSKTPLLKRRVSK